jgi:hypothetical protein
LAFLFRLIYKNRNNFPNHITPGLKKRLEKQLFNRCLTNFVILEEPNDANFAFSLFPIHAICNVEMAGLISHPVNRINCDRPVVLADESLFF